MGICSGTSTGWLFVHCSRSNWNLAVSMFAEGGKPENPEKTPRSEDENQQQTQLTYDTGSGIRTRATLVGGERSHHFAITAPGDDVQRIELGLTFSQNYSFCAELCAELFIQKAQPVFGAKSVLKQAEVRCLKMFYM